MKKYLSFSFLAYGLATGINKGLFLFAIPVLEGELTIEEYGLWNLCLVFTVVLGPVISLNGYSSIIRFGINDSTEGQRLYKKYLLYSTFSVPIILAISILRSFDWISLSLLLSVVEGFQLLLLGWYRSQDKFGMYLSVSLIKLIALGLTILLVDKLELEILLIWQLAIGSVLIVPFIIKEVSYGNKGKLKNPISYYVRFSLYLLPHGLALWILGSSDRVLIKYAYDDKSLGTYSLAYSLALVLMLVNSGVGLTLPNFILKYYENYINSKLKSVLILIYSTITLVLGSAILILIHFTKSYVSYFNGVTTEFYWIVCFALIGIYYLGIYYFYSNILFFHNKSKWISANTFCVSLINLLLTYQLLIYFGILGAAFATAIAYFIYFIMNFYLSTKIDRRTCRDVFSVLPIVLTTTILLLGVYYIFLENFYATT